MNELEQKESFFRRNRAAIIAVVLTVVAAVLTRKTMSGDKSGRYPFGSDSDFGKIVGDSVSGVVSSRVDRQFRTPMVETTTNTWYPSQTEAAKQFDVAQGAISRNARNMLPSTSVKGLDFKFDYQV